MFRSPFADGVVILVILLLFFGPKRLPMLSRSIGESIKEFKGGIDDASSEHKQEITSAPAASATSEAAESVSESKTSA